MEQPEPPRVTYVNEPRGTFIAFMGLPGSGKTTIATGLAGLMAGSELFCEPEESNWPLAITGRHEYGYASAITCFRSMRVPQLFMAHKIRCRGGVAIVDSYYDKLLSRYIMHEQMAWLIPKSDPYFEVIASLSHLDWDHLPDADHLVFVRVTKQQWTALLAARGRALDQEKGLINSFATQDAFLDAAGEFAATRHSTLHVINQNIGSPNTAAQAAFDAVLGR